MDNQTKYEEMKNNNQQMIKEMNLLRKNPDVIRYLELKEKMKKQKREQDQLYAIIKKEEYASCNHIWIESYHEYDSKEGRSYSYHGCIKCGLDTKILDCEIQSLTPSYKVMYRFLRDNRPYRKGLFSDVLCDLDLAKAIYTKIKEYHPNIDDQTALYYLKIALADIRKIEVSEDRKKSRIKRLGLIPEFHKWNDSDVKSCF